MRQGRGKRPPLQTTKKCGPAWAYSCRRIRTTWPSRHTKGTTHPPNQQREQQQPRKRDKDGADPKMVEANMKRVSQVLEGGRRPDMDVMKNYMDAVWDGSTSSSADLFRSIIGDHKILQVVINAVELNLWSQDQQQPEEIHCWQRAEQQRESIRMAWRDNIANLKTTALSLRYADIMRTDIVRYPPTLAYLNSTMMTTASIRDILPNGHKIINELWADGIYKTGEVARVKRRGGWTTLESVVSYFSPPQCIIASSAVSQFWVIYFKEDCSVRSPDLQWNESCTDNLIRRTFDHWSQGKLIRTDLIPKYYEQIRQEAGKMPKRSDRLELNNVGYATEGS